MMILHYIRLCLLSFFHYILTMPKIVLCIWFILYPVYAYILRVMINASCFKSKKARDFLHMGEHAIKKNTSTMGGLAFYILLPVLYIFYNGSIQFWFIALTSGLSGLIGLIDDVLKIKKCEGLTIKKKFLLQMAAALCSGIFFYVMSPEQNCINIFGYHLYLGIGYIFWITFVIMGTCHAVNLTDGIDGLVISQILIIQSISPLIVFFNNFSGIYLNTINMFWTFFFLINTYKAKIFMGDVGAFFLGGYLASSFIAARCEIVLIFSGIVFVFNTLIVMIQIIHYKIYKKRLFSFTPYHHALEKKGLSENKICIVFSLITTIGSLISLWVYRNYYV